MVERRIRAAHFTVSIHIIFPAFTIGLAAWLTILDGLHLTTGRRPELRPSLSGRT
jgi:cytochrome bd-type quinol oxidase subunit 1